MSFRWPIDMKEAVRLTRSGQLGEAAKAIRAALSGRATTVSPSQAAAGQGEKVRAAGPSPGLKQPFPGFDLPKMRPGVAPPVPPGASFARFEFAGSEGGRPYKLYVPSGYSGKPMPLLVMLHGCTQSADDFAVGTRMNEVAEGEGFLVAYPEQIKAVNAHGCWNWFKPQDQARDRGEPALIVGIVRQIMRDFAVDPCRVYVAGLSAGGAAAAVLASTYPDIFAAAGIHSGLACGAARDLPSALMAMRQGRSSGPAGRRIAIPVILFHGDGDKTVHPANADGIAEQSCVASGPPPIVSAGRSQAGMPFTRAIHRDGQGRVMLERWTLHDAGHAWSGGDPRGSYTDPRGPDASREMARFFGGAVATLAK
jgi:poly(hydroxyalkanoate) depolymerase family esterase